MVMTNQLLEIEEVVGIDIGKELGRWGLSGVELREEKSEEGVGY